MEDNDKETDDQYIWLAIHALDFLREEKDVSQDIKDFTHIVIKMIVTMEKWEDIKDDEHCCNMILYAFEEFEKKNFRNCSIMLRGHYRSMMGQLRFWNENRVNDEKI